MVDVRIEVNDKLPIFIIENIGDIPADGEAYMFIEPQTGNKNEKNSIVRNSKITEIEKSEFDNYLFAKVNFNLKPGEINRYNYPFQPFLEKICNKQNEYHFIRIDYSYESISHKGKFDYVSTYHMLPPGNNVEHWTASRVNVDMNFQRYVENEKDLPKYSDFKKL